MTAPPKRMTKDERALARLMFDVSEEICLAQERTTLTDAAVAKRAGMNTIRYKFLKQGVAPAVEYRELAAVAAALSCRLHLFLADLDTDEWAARRVVQDLRVKPKVKPKPPKLKIVKGGEFEALHCRLAQASKEVASWPAARKANINYHYKDEKPDIFGQLDNLGKG